MQTNQGETSGSNVEPIVATAGAAEFSQADTMRSTPAAAAVEPRRPKPGILRLDISKPRRSSGGSVDFRCVSGGTGAGGVTPGGGGGGNGSNSATATGANSEVSEHDLLYTRECLRFVHGARARGGCSKTRAGESIDRISNTWSSWANRENLLIYGRP